MDWRFFIFTTLFELVVIFNILEIFDLEDLIVVVEGFPEYFRFRGSVATLVIFYSEVRLIEVTR